MNQFERPNCIILFAGVLEFIFLETDPATGKEFYVVEFWCCDDPVKVSIREIFPSARAALKELLRIRDTRFINSN
jgi:hypothetical protein